MKKGSGSGKNWLLVLALMALFGAARVSDFPLLDKVEGLAYDSGVNMSFRNPGVVKKIAIVAIDDASIEHLGQWPWSRSILADTVRYISRAGASVTGIQLPLMEPQSDTGLTYVQKAQEHIKKASYRRKAVALVKLLNQAERELDADSKLVRTLTRTRNAVLPMGFILGDPPQTKKGANKTIAALPDYIKKNQLTKIKASKNAKPRTAIKAWFPLQKFGDQTSAIGHNSFFQNTHANGSVRSEPLVVDYYGEYYPSMALMMAARSLGISARHIKNGGGPIIQLGNLKLKTDSRMQLYMGFQKNSDNKPPFATYSFYKVYQGEVPKSAFRNKIVLLGPTATGISRSYQTPTSSSTSAAQLTADIIASILNQDFYTRPSWSDGVEWGLLAAVAFYLLVIVPRLGIGAGTFVSFVLLLGLLASGQYLMISQKLWLGTAGAALFLLIGHITLTIRRLFGGEHIKQLVESDSAQSNRMLGLAFQAQGQLDMAMDKFRKLPVDNSVLDLIYSLALDYERKRQFNKAVAAYDYILGYKKKFRDVQQRKQRAAQAEGTLMIGGKGVAAGGTLILDISDQKPTLGRYEVERELGKGAMGIVYQGRDPKINRVVAIKTLALSEEFEGNELTQAKERFFREAETAGRLNHPNIVTIYDAGEEHDLAYIAMEFLHGKDLTEHVESKKQSPVPWVLDIVARVADALDYAHKQDVVHRDIKPANIMYNEEDDTVKVTDFGIARITAASNTKTGMVLGTPSYMSPEQLAAKPVDGRSDLFSLGVTMYELLTKKQPFTGDSMAALMYQITNSRHPDISKYRKDIPACVRNVIDKVLQKDPRKRYQTGEEFREAVERCVKKAA